MSSLPESSLTVQSTLRLVPAKGEPQSLVEMIDHEARAYRERGDSFGRFLSRQLERLAQLVLWTGAETPEDHEDRMEVWDSEIASRHYDSGFESGLEYARREYGLRHGFPID
jgi:hypothetical protein